MLFSMEHLDKIAKGHITVAFRRQKRPTVKAGGTLTTAIGVLAIDEVERTSLSAIDAADAARAGFASKAELVRELQRRGDAPVYRVCFHHAGEDPRIALRNQTELTDDDAAELEAKLERFDQTSPQGAWVERTLVLIGNHPKRRAPELADELGLETKLLKGRVRKLKGLGLTESLQIGYRLSPRGQALARHRGWTISPVESSAEGAAARSGAATGPAKVGSDDGLSSAKALLAYFEEAGVVLQAAKGPVPTLTHQIAGHAFNTSWWGHPRGALMFDLLSALAADDDALGCRLYRGKKAWVHRRLWPHLAVLSPRLPDEHTAVVEEEHTARGAHRAIVTPLLDWLPNDALVAASGMSEEEALDGLGWWVGAELDRT